MSTNQIRREVDTDLARRSGLAGFAFVFFWAIAAAATDLPQLYPFGYGLVGLVTVVSCVIRTILSQRFREYYGDDPRQWRYAFGGAILMNSLTWGLFIGVAITDIGIQRWDMQVLLLLLVAALPIGAMSLHSYRWLAVPFQVSFLLPATLGCLVHGSWQARTLAGALVAFFIYLMFITIRLSREYAEKLERSQALDEARRAAEEASSAKTDFLANISHELRTPMTGIIGMTHLALSTTLDGEQREYMETVQSSSQALLRLLNELLDFAKIEAGKVELEWIGFSPRELVAECVRAFQGLSREKGMALELRCSSSLPDRVYGDPGRIRQILVNMLGNAVKFTERGHVRVVAEACGLTDQSVRLRFHVEDTGPGIPKEKQASIFEPFEQSDRSISRRHGGSGLGLSISARLAQRMNGRIWVDSAVGLGSTFHVEIECALQGVDLSPTAMLQPITEDPSPKRILVVEDNPVNQRLLQRLLEKRGHSVLIAHNGREGVESFLREPFDLVLMDVQMPEMDGIEATAAMRRAEKAVRTPIIALTAHAAESSRKEFLNAGMDEFLPKPVDPKRLYQLVGQLCGTPAAKPEAPAGSPRKEDRQERRLQKA